MASSKKPRKKNPTKKGKNMEFCLQCTKDYQTIDDQARQIHSNILEMLEKYKPVMKEAGYNNFKIMLDECKLELDVSRHDVNTLTESFKNKTCNEEDFSFKLIMSTMNVQETIGKLHQISVKLHEFHEELTKKINEIKEKGVPNDGDQ